MKKRTILLGILFLCLTAACASAASPTIGKGGKKSAKALLRNAGGQPVGEAVFQETPEGVKIRLKAHHLPPGTHGFHIHESGACTPPDFKSAGGHFNPSGKKHGIKNPQGHHAGDLPNLVVGSDGTVDVEVIAGGVGLSGENSLFSRSLVVHADPDDDRTDPAGNAGARIACGEIGPSS